MIVERIQEGKSIAKLEPDYREGRSRVYSPTNRTYFKNT